MRIKMPCQGQKVSNHNYNFDWLYTFALFCKKCEIPLTGVYPGRYGVSRIFVSHGNSLNFV